MRVLRSGIAAAVVAMLCTLSLVVGAARADAEVYDCRGSILCELGRNPNDPDAMPVTDLGGAYNAITGWLASIGKVQADCIGGHPDSGQCDLVEGYAVGKGGARMKLAGTSTEVKAGDAMQASGCASMTACHSILDGMRLLNPSGLKDVSPTNADPDTGKPLVFPPGVYYPATVVSRGPYADLKSVVSGVEVGAPQHRRDPISSTDTDSVCPLSTNATATTNVTVTWRASTVNRTTGEWLHRGGELMWTVHGGVPEEGACLDPSGLGSHPPSDWELRSFNVVADRPGVLNELTSGFSWGQTFYPENSSNRATVRCQRADGSDFDVVGQETLIAFHKVVVPACPAGTNPLWTQLDVVAPDGTVYPQSTQNNRPTWDTEALPPANSPYPQCADGSCIWIVKVGDTWCARAVAGCTDWAERPGEAKCFLGPYELPLTRCGHLERVYENNPEPIPGTKTNTDGKPSTSEGPVVVRDPAPDATPAPGPTTTPRPSPTPTGTAGPTPSPSPSGKPGDSGAPKPSDPEGSQCWPSGWGMFNPAEWVLKPIRCAFVPKKSDLENLRNETIGPIRYKGIARWEFVFTGWASAWNPTGDSSCRGPAVDVSKIAGAMDGQDTLPNTIYPFDACTGVKRQVANTSNALLSAAILFFGGWRLVRIVGRPFGYDLNLMKGEKD